MPRILQLYTELTNGGGIPKVIENLQRDLPGHETYVGLFNTTPAAYLEVRNLVAIGPRLGRKTFRTWVSAWRGRLRELRRVKTELNIEVTIAHTVWLHLLNVLAGGPDKKILLVHGSIRYDINYPFWKKCVLASALPLYFFGRQRFVMVSEELLREARWYFLPGKSTYIHNYLNVEGIRRRSEEALPAEFERLFERHPVFITVGRLHHQKNHAFLVRLFARLRSLPAYSEARLLIVGAGNQLTRLRTLAESLGLEVAALHDGAPVPLSADVVFTGYLANPFPLVKRASLYFSTSLYEGYSLSICEAIALNTPVIASDCPTGNIEILYGGNERRIPHGILRHGALLPIKGISEEVALGRWFRFFQERTLTGLVGELRTDNCFTEAHKRAQLDKWKALIGAEA